VEAPGRVATCSCGGGGARWRWLVTRTTWGDDVGWEEEKGIEGLSKNWEGRRKGSRQFLNPLMFIGCHITDEHER
jgi:hypothetical protein